MRISAFDPEFLPHDPVCYAERGSPKKFSATPAPARRCLRLPLLRTRTMTRRIPALSDSFREAPSVSQRACGDGRKKEKNECGRDAVAWTWERLVSFKERQAHEKSQVILVPRHFVPGIREHAEKSAPQSAFQWLLQ